MKIGVPKEIKDNEFRVGLTPDAVGEFVSHGHDVYIEKDAGFGIGESDNSYRDRGAKIVLNAHDVFEASDMIIKVKEPLASERKMLKKDQILFTYLHLAPDYEQTVDLMNSGSICIAYETVTDTKGGLPLLKPMSEVAGRMSIQAAAWGLESNNGGRGVLIGGVSGVAPAKVVIIGGGVAGFNAAQMAVGQEGEVVILEKDPTVISYLKQYFGNRAKVLFSHASVLSELVLEADVVVGAVLIPGAKAPNLVTADMVKKMKTGSVLVDIAIDQGGCFETSKPTTHTNPTFVVDDVVHYCVANMPGAVPRTSTFALTNVTLKYGLNIADKGWKRALSDDENILNGLNICNGSVTRYEVATGLGLDYVASSEFLSS